LIVADMQINVHHPIRMIATAVGVAGFPSQLSEGGGNHPAQDSIVTATSRKRSIMAVTWSGTSS
jgi:hypothetical protein